MYINVVLNFLKDFEQSYKSPEKISTGVIKEWLKQSPSISTLKIRIGALKNFYQRVVHQPLKFAYIEYPRKEIRHPIILSDTEMKQLFNACINIKHKAIMYVAYATGVRVSELLNIKLSDIDRGNGVIHIVCGKGNKQRSVTMKPELLKIIKDYFYIYRPKEYLFENPNGGKYTSSSINKFLKKYALLAGIKKNIHIHLLRHQYTSNAVEFGKDIYATSKILGHKKVTTTAEIYCHINPNIIKNAYSPIQNILS
jgi:site-specific recombinase XerD